MDHEKRGYMKRQRVSIIILGMENNVENQLERVLFNR